MAKKVVYNAVQLPNSADDKRIEWSGDEWNIWIEFNQEKNTMRLRGESLEWEDDGHGDGDWKSQPMSRDEILDIAEAVKLILPTTTGDKQIAELFKRKTKSA